MALFTLTFELPFFRRPRKRGICDGEERAGVEVRRKRGGDGAGGVYFPIGGNELDEKAIECKNKIDVDSDDKGASVKRTEAECVSRSEKSCATNIYSECGSSSAPLEGNDPMKLWKAMKQNGFLSNPHVGGVSVTSSSCVVSSAHGGIPIYQVLNFFFCFPF
ncbi:hypothetical protein Bca52824_011260 [Brassica carinata]|uniref:Uncharacterized protein n=1 Tax=Brassica carinata TaxID=52824 RepID=A0A8X7WFY9_BRACI|nr:hypothetical protein Bca52824_011260 [Brassica carinata]